MGTKTANYDFWMPEVDADENLWGDMLNANWASLDTLLKTLTGESKSIIIENPTSSEDISFFFTDVAMTVSKMRAGPGRIFLLPGNSTWGTCVTELTGRTNWTMFIPLCVRITGNPGTWCLPETLT